MPSDKILGIDLGTTNSAFGIIENGEPTILPNSKGNDVTPSVVSFRGDEVLVGEAAKNVQIENPDRTISSIKRKMGREEYTETIGSEEYTPEEISAFILRKIKRDAEEYVGEEITRAVITVPAYFTDRQRQATIQAGELAELEVERVINEPTAAAIAYGIDDDRNQTILVFDLGGGTFDVSLLDLGQGVYDVVATNGDTRLGGDDWDQALVDHFAQRFEEDHGISLKDKPEARIRLKESSEEVKKTLSSTYRDTISEPFITNDEDGNPVNLSYDITRERFNNLTMSLRSKLEDPIEQVLQDAGVNKHDIDDVVLVGGSTRMPQVRQKVNDMFGMEPINHIDPDKAVALGATIQAGLITGETEDAVLLDVTPLSLGIEVKGGLFERLIPRNSTLPHEESKVFTTSHDNQKTVNISVYQGEERVAERNEFLDEFVLSGIPRAEAGTPEVEVTFRIDLDGIVHVSAEEKASGQKKSIEIVGGSGIAGDKLNEMKQRQDEVERVSEEKKREKRLKTRAEELVENAENVLTNEDVSVDVRVASDLEDEVRVAKDYIESTDPDLDSLAETVDELEMLVGQFDPSKV